MKIAVLKRNAKTECSVNQQLTRRSPTVNRGAETHHGLHEFRWIETNSGGTAICSCGCWMLYGTRPGIDTQRCGAQARRVAWERRCATM